MHDLIHVGIITIAHADLSYTKAQLEQDGSTVAFYYVLVGVLYFMRFLQGWHQQYLNVGQHWCLY